MSPIDYNHQLYCALSVSDTGSAIDWYQRVLGFKLRESIGAFAILETPVEGVVLGLGQGEVRQTNGAELTWGVTDIEAAERSLTAEGVRTEPINDIPNVVRLLAFFDPDGNRLQFWAEPKA
ncbi:MAG TPA: VOC family protein [Dehalococcoidia bacterium]